MFYLEDYIGYLVAERGASPATVNAYRGDLQKYCLFLVSERDVHEASLVKMWRRSLPIWATADLPLAP